MKRKLNDKIIAKYKLTNEQAEDLYFAIYTILQKENLLCDCSLKSEVKNINSFFEENEKILLSISKLIL